MSANASRVRVVAVFVVVGAALAAVSFHRYQALERELTATALARHGSIASLAAVTVAERFERLKDIAVSLSTRVRFQQLVAEGRWDEAVQIMRRVPQEFGYVERVFLADPAGVLTADTPALPDVRGRSFAERDWFRGVSRNWQPHVSELYLRAGEPRRHVIAVAVPVQGASGAAGVLVLQVKPESFFTWMIGKDFGEGARALVADGQGRVAFDTRSVGPGTAPQRTLNLAASPGTKVVSDAAGGPQVVRSAAAATHGWSVVIEQPVASVFAQRDKLLHEVLLDSAAIALLALGAIALGALALQERRRGELGRAQNQQLRLAQDALATQAERLRIVHEIDRAIISVAKPEAIAAAVLQPLRQLLGVARANINLVDSAADDVEWFASAGRQRTHIGSGLRFPAHLIGDVDGLKRGEPQRIDTCALPASKERDALLATGVRYYMAVPMIAGGELIGAVSFGGEQDSFPEEQVTIAREVATQLAVAIGNAKLYQKVQLLNAGLEQRVRERTAELQAANRELEAFSYTVSHDLRAPLRAVDGYALMLEEDYAASLDDEGRRLLGVVRSEARRMGELIDDLLAFSRIGRQPISMVATDMGALARDVAGELSQRFPAARIDIGRMPPARGDRALLRQVWANLIGNALKYSAKRDDPRVEIGGGVEGEEHVYWVRDNGAGFDMKYAAKLFQVFQRLHDAHEFEGTGVGLAIVHRIIVRHGGRVWAEGRPGEGAAFFLALPREGTHGAV